jgi:hypothetical protein
MRILKAAAACYVALSLCACQKITDTYRPPARREPLAGAIPSPDFSAAAMTDPKAAEFFLHGIDSELSGNAWRWTGPNPALRLRAPAAPPFDLVIDFAVAEVTFRGTGPLSIAVTLNAKPFDTIRCAAPGRMLFRKEVQAELLRPGDVAEVALSIDKTWKAPDSDRLYGIQLLRVALER